MEVANERCRVAAPFGRNRSGRSGVATPDRASKSGPNGRQSHKTSGFRSKRIGNRFSEPWYEAMLAGERWRKVSWQRGTKGRLTCLFAARRVRIAEGHKHRMPDDRRQCLPGDEVWLVGERRSTGEQKYYVSNLPTDATLNTLAAAIKAAGRKKRVGGPPPQPSMPALRQAILDLFARPPTRQCPHCEKPLTDPIAPNLPK